MNSTDEYWDVDGFSLQTYGWNIETKGGSRDGVPGMKSGNVAVPNRRGERWVPKQLDARTIQLQMWVQGSDADGKRTARGARQQWSMNWHDLRNRLFVYRRQMVLTKRWRDSNGILQSATALGEFVGGLEPTMNGGARSSFTVDIRLADPLWYGPTQNFSLTAGAPTNVAIVGDVPSSRITLAIAGTATNPRLTDSTTPPNRFLLLTDVVTGAQTVTVDVDGFSAVKAGQALSHKITHDSAGYWFEMQPGTRTLLYSRDSGTGAAMTVQYQPAYL